MNSRRRLKRGVILIVLGLFVGSISCGAPWTYRDGGAGTGLDEWQGQIVELNREQGTIVVRSRERLLDYAFRITPRTEITSPARGSASLETGQWVTVQYRRDSDKPGPPAALRVVVIR
jgi:hypothetical protein